MSISPGLNDRRVRSLFDTWLRSVLQDHQENTTL
jgi:hypothetical protein